MTTIRPNAMISNDDQENELSNDDSHHRHIAIVGAGMAGLTCAKELLLKVAHPIHVTIVEAAAVVGGRVGKLPVSNVQYPFGLDAGAELIHGRDHLLWRTIRDYQQRGLLPTIQGSNQSHPESVPFEFEGLEPHFILAHADGGPEDEPTPQGKYGMYFIDGELVMYNDPKVQPLVEVMEAVLDPSKYDEYTDDTSLADALGRPGIPQISESLHQLCVAGYGNTAGCCDLSQLSIRQLMSFEHWWETNEVEGDFRPIFGMHRVVDAMLHELQDTTNYKHAQSILQITVNTPVERICQSECCLEKIQVQCGDEQSSSSMLVDAVVVTVPPTRLAQLFDSGRDDLPIHKRQALERIGFADRVVKICCKFRSTSTFWPQQLQSIVAAGQSIPELWLNRLAEDYHVVVGYLVSTAANALMDRIRTIQEEAFNTTGKPTSRETCAGQVMLQQLSTIFKISVQELQREFLDDETQVVDWKDDFDYIQGGYMFPKVGMKTGHDLGVLAEPILDHRVMFAGEATNTNACCTVQSAMETGVRAATEVQSRLFATARGSLACE